MPTKMFSKRKLNLKKVTASLKHIHISLSIYISLHSILYCYLKMQVLPFSALLVLIYHTFFFCLMFVFVRY